MPAVVVSRLCTAGQVTQQPADPRLPDRLPGTVPCCPLPAALKARQPAINPPLPALPELPPLPAGAPDAPQGCHAGGAGGDGGLGISSAQLRRLAADAYAASLSPSLLPAAAAGYGSNGAGNGAGNGASGGSSASSISFSEERRAAA